MTSYLKNQIRKVGVKTRFGEKFTPSVVNEIKPDVVILATGGLPFVPEIPGIYRRNVMTNTKLHRQLKIFLKWFGPGLLRWLTKFWMPVGKKVVIIGGGMAGVELGG